MPPRRVIGIDAGGTKLLGGVVDEDLVVHHRVHRVWRGADRQETLDIFLDSVEEVRAAAPKVEAVGFGIPALVEWETGVARWSQSPAAAGRALPRPHERAARPPGGRRQRRQRVGAGRVPRRSRCGGASRGDGLAGDRNRHGALPRRARLPGLGGARRRARSLGARHTRRRMPERLPGPRLLRDARLRQRDRPRGPARRGGAARVGARQAACLRPRDHRRDRHRAGPQRRPGRARGARRDRHAARLRARGRHQRRSTPR